MPITLTLTVQDWSMILTGLGKLPYEAVFQVIQQVVQKIEAQAMPPRPMRPGNGADHPDDYAEPEKPAAFNELPRSMR